MFKRLFKRKDNEITITKTDYWKKWEFFELFDDLKIAENILVEKANSNFLTQKFKDEFIEHINEIKGDNVIDFTLVRQWFSPDGEWQNNFGKEYKELQHNIFHRADKWKRNDDFFVGTKVSMNNEFGVVLDRENENDFYGLICWDTAKENDFEDWRGLFGTFIDNGGKVIDQDYEFQFINNDGTPKKVCS